MPFPAVVDLDDVAAGSGGFKIQGENAYEAAGFAVAAAGDVNGDGIGDLIVGAFDNDSGGLNSGAAYVVFGATGGFATPVDLDAVAAGSGGFKIQGEREGGGAGGSVALAGDVNGDGIGDLIVGSRYADAAYVVFGRAGAFANLVDLDAIAAGSGGFKIQGETEGGALGRSVSAAGDVNGDGIDDLIVGAPYNDSGGDLAGAAYVVFGNAGIATLVDLDAIAAGTGGFKIQGEGTFDQAGGSVAAAGDVNGDGIDDLIVGARGHDNFAGAAYVVFGRAGGITTPVELEAVAAGTGGFRIESENAAGNVGFSVATAGDVNGDGIGDLIVGAISSGDGYEGAAYVIFGVAGGMTGPVDLDAIAQGNGGFAIQGENAGDEARFSVAAAGDVNNDGIDDLIVGAVANAGGGANAGAAYVVLGRSDGFTTPIDLETVAAGIGGFKIQGENAVDFAGASVSAAGDVNGDGIDDLIVGAFQNGSGGDGAGAAYVVFGTDDAIPPPPPPPPPPFPAILNLSEIADLGGFKIQGEDARDSAGRSVSAAGDVNGDGIDDLIVGSQNDSGGDGAGAAYVVLGTTGGSSTPVNLDAIAAGTGGFKIQGQEPGDAVGYSVSAAGDVNGDGLDDLIVGGRDVDGGGYDAGAAYVVFGRTSGFAAVVDLDVIAAGAGGFKIQGEDAGDSSGCSVAAAGDVNGDGIDDLIVGARGDNAGEDRAGAAYVVFGDTGGFATPIDLGAVAAGNGGFQVLGENEFDECGVSVSAAGDVNGDGIDDLIVGAPFNDSGGNDAGAAYVVFGATRGFATPVDLKTIADGVGGFKIQGENAGDSAGRSVATAGDVNGDGIDDLIVGAYKNSNGGLVAGAAYVVFGKSGGFATPVDLDDIAGGIGGFVIEGEDTFDRAGCAVAAAGDVNGDGIGDLIVGAYSDEGSGSYAGAAYVVFGKTGGFSSLVDLGIIAAGVGGFKIQGDEGDGAGVSVGAAGDTNGDGIDDLIVGAPSNGSGGLLAGAAYVIFGRRDALFTDGDDTRDLNDFDLDSLTPAQATRGLGGNDIVTLSATQNLGILFVGNTGDDTITGSSHGDRIRGDAGSDTLLGRGGGDMLWGTEDGDLLDGGRGADRLNGGNDGDSLCGGTGDDHIFGRGGVDRASASDGDDRVFGGQGNDRLWGGTGNDLLSADAGRDILTGGAGVDVFRFSFTNESRPGAVDRVTDFTPGDLIDLSRIDAMPGGADDTFILIGDSEISAAGQLRVFVSGGTTFLQGNTIGVGGTELLIALSGSPAIGEADLVL